MERTHQLRRNSLLIVGLCLATLFLSACSASKFLDDGQSILKDAEIKSSQKAVNPSTFNSLLRQRPNSRWFSLVKVPLGIYCLSGRDSARAWNKFIRRLGEAPVIYNPDMTESSRTLMRQALINRGYLHAEVDTISHEHRRRTLIRYLLRPGRLYTVGNIDWNIENSEIDSLVRGEGSATLLYKGMPCSLNMLEDERARIVNMLQNKGYYAFDKDLITYTADTVSGSANVDLTVYVRHAGGKEDSLRAYRKYHHGKIRVWCDASPLDTLASPVDSLEYEGLWFFFRGKRPLVKPKRIAHNLLIRPGRLYRDHDVQQSYRNLARMPIIQYSHVRFNNAGTADSSALDCNAVIRTGKINAVNFELEGTNTAGDLGAAALLGFTNRNVFRGGETFNLKVRAAFEAITGLEGYADQNYWGVSVEANLDFPHFVCPFFSSLLKRTSRVTTTSSLMYDSQNRPEFHRRVLTAVWRYRWTSWRQHMSHSLDVININYVFMPWISDSFRRNYLDSIDNPRKSVLRYSYENQLIASIGYRLTYNTLGGQASPMGLYHTNAYQIKLNVELAGNMLNLLARGLHTHRDAVGHNTVLGVAYAQYAKLDFDYAKSFLIDDRNSLALHGAFGVVVPYGNSDVVPYEKRYFAGGANSVRGWSVRELGPGKFRGRDGRIDFINQTGNIRLDLSIEYRTFLFWKLHGALFVDAGNIWTIRKYAEQPGGEFSFKNFAQQIAVAYGAGFRFNFNYFVLRFDMGMKAIDPAYSHGKRHYPIANPKFSRDFTFHFAVGLPF